MVAPGSKKLSTRVLRAILSVYFVVVLVLAAVQVNMEYAQTKNDILIELAELENIFYEPLRGALWASMVQQVEVLADSITKLSFVTGIEVTNEDIGLNVAQFLTMKPNLFHRFQLSYVFEENSVYLATVTIYSDSSVVLNRLKTGVSLLIVQVFIVSTVMTLMFIWVIRNYLKTPLEQFANDITSATEEKEDGKQFVVNISAEYFEFEPLANILTTMGIRISQQFDATLKIIDDLEINKQRLETAQKVAQMASWDWDIVNNDIHWSEEAFRVLGLNPNVSVATFKEFMQLVHPGDRKKVSIAIYNAQHCQKPLNTKHRIVLSDGTIRFLHEQALTIYDLEGEATRMFGFTQDITETHEMLQKLSESEKSLMKNEKDLQKLAGRLLSIQEEERRRLARELHDDLSQRLAVIAIEADTVDIEECNCEATNALQNVQDKLITISEDVHRISRQLHPSVIEDLGLEQALRSEITNFSRLEEIPVKLEYDLGSLNVSLELAISLFRVTQESLRNIQKHAHAKNVSIKLVLKNSSLVLTIIDDGRGFMPEAKDMAGLGMKSMRERMRLVNGSISYISEQNRGTIVSARIDISS